jgi:hypothetical protein
MQVREEGVKTRILPHVVPDDLEVQAGVNRRRNVTQIRQDAEMGSGFGK